MKREHNHCRRHHDKPTIPGPDPDTRTPKFSFRRWPATRIPTSSAPVDKYPYAPGRPYTPPDAPLEDFRALHKKLGIGRAVIVNASVHGTDNRVALDAIAVSNGTFRAVANIDDSITERGLRELHEGGFRGCRFNFVRHLGGVPDMAVFHRIVAMVAPLGWHIDLHFDAIDLPEYAGDAGKIAGSLHHRSHGARQGRRRARPASVPDADRPDDSATRNAGSRYAAANGCPPADRRSTTRCRLRAASSRPRRTA